MPTNPAGIVIQVTQEDIENSIKRNSSHCMIAEAIKRCIPNARHVSVDLQTIRFSDYGMGQRAFYLTPRSVQKAIIDFDQGSEGLEPLKFTLRQPHRVPMNISAPKEANKRGVVTKHHHGGKKKPLEELIETSSKTGWPSVRIGRRRQFGLRALEV